MSYGTKEWSEINSGEDDLRNSLYGLIDAFTGNREVHTPHLVDQIIKLFNTQLTELIAEIKHTRTSAYLIEQSNDKLRKEHHYMKKENEAILDYITRHLDPEWLADIKQTINKSTL